MQRFRRMRTIALLLAVTSSVTLAQQPKAKLKVREVVWGFDGKVLPNSFNPVSILLDNQGEEAFDGVITLRARQGLSYAGARLVSEAYVQPRGERWVQFTPYVPTDSQFPWQLSWRGGSAELQPAKAGRDAFIMLVSRSGLSTGSRGLRNFDEEVFPATVAATAPLGSVVLDHVPRWEQPRRQAFSDWLRRGGNLHLLLTDDDTYPQFSDELAMLNNPAKTQSYGAGVVFRHRLTRGQIRRGFEKQARAMEDAFRGIPEKDSDEALAESIQQSQDLSYGGFDSFGWDASSSLHSHLVEMTRPDHQWALIYLMSVVYILMIFPGCYLLGRKRFHYLAVYGAILGTAAIFSVLFLFIGQRGYGERTSVNSVAMAVHLDDDHFDVMQWGNAFVTSGGTYEIRHSGNGRVYASGQASGLNAEAVDGSVSLRETNGEIGTSFVSEVPPFSNRLFISRQRVKVPGFDTKLTECSIDGELQKVTIQAGKGFESCERIFLFHRETVYSAGYKDGWITMSAKIGQIMDAIDSDALQRNNYGFMYDNDPIPAEQRYRQMMNHMLTYRFQIQKKADKLRARLPADRIRVLAYVPMPDELRIVGEEFPAQQGYVLVSKDLPIEVTP